MGDQGSGTMTSPETDRDPVAPARVSFAFDIVHWANELEKGSPQRSYDGGPAGFSDGRDLKKCEKSVYDAALEVMRLYLTGEMSFEDVEEFQEASDDASQTSSETCFFCKDTGEAS